MDISYWHYRYEEDSDSLKEYSRRLKQFRPATRGGITICTIKGENGLYAGASFCSRKDNFCYSLGRKIALGRALKNYDHGLGITSPEIATEFLGLSKILPNWPLGQEEP